MIAPELIYKRQTSLQGDIWSLGLIFYFVITGKYISTEDYLAYNYIILETAIKENHSKFMTDIFILI